jgi:hypothetical protein
MGLGRMTLAEACEHQGIGVEAAIAALKAEGVDAAADTRVRDLIQGSGKTGRELLDILERAKN